MRRPRRWRRMPDAPQPRSLSRPARPIHTFRRGHALLNRDLPTARPLVALQRRIAGLIVDGLVITEAIPDTEDLDALLRMRLLDQPPARQRPGKRHLTAQRARPSTPAPSWTPVPPGSPRTSTTTVQPGHHWPASWILQCCPSRGPTRRNCYR